MAILIDGRMVDADAIPWHYNRYDSEEFGFSYQVSLHPVDIK